MLSFIVEKKNTSIFVKANGTEDYNIQRHFGKLSEKSFYANNDKKGIFAEIFTFRLTSTASQKLWSTIIPSLRHSLLDRL